MLWIEGMYLEKFKNCNCYTIGLYLMDKNSTVSNEKMKQLDDMRLNLTLLWHIYSRYTTGGGVEFPSPPAKNTTRGTVKKN